MVTNARWGTPVAMRIRPTNCASGPNNRIGQSSPPRPPTTKLSTRSLRDPSCRVGEAEYRPWIPRPRRRAPSAEPRDVKTVHQWNFLRRRSLRNRAGPRDFPPSSSDLFPRCTSLPLWLPWNGFRVKVTMEPRRPRPPYMLLCSPNLRHPRPRPRFRSLPPHTISSRIGSGDFRVCHL